MNLYERIIDEYMQQIFYFALRKTSSRYDAEDLTHTVMTEIFAALERGIVPDNERAWVWRIVRNHYAKWTAYQVRERDNIDIDEMRESISDGSAVEDGLIREEELNLLYRELAHLTWDYRYIVCEYYFANRTLADIAESLSLPLGTVKRKISECRKHLKEGMKMARTYGKRSFDPDLVEFGQNWDPSTGPDGRRYVEHSIAQNILLEAYDNPSTAEDLSLALGVAMPYMEDEIRFLMEGELLTEKGGQYRTNIVILSKKVQDEISSLALDYVEKMTELVKKAVEEVWNKPECPRNQSFEDMKLALTERVMCHQSKPYTTSCDYIDNVHTICHKDGSKWALVGFERTESKLFNNWLGVTGNEDGYQAVMIGNRDKFDMADIELSEIPVFKDEETLFSTSYADAVDDLYISYLECRNKLLADDIPSYLHGTAAVMTNIDFRKLVIDRMTETGYIKLPCDMNKSAVGVCKRS